MIRVTICNKNLSINGFKVAGHANYSDTDKDIVCAAVSILTYTALNSLKEVALLEEKVIEFKEEEGLLIVNIKENNIISEAIFGNFIVGIKLLLENYSDYITLKYEEV